MCNRYIAAPRDAIEQQWQISAAPGHITEWPHAVHPRSPGPFLRAGDGDGAELVIGQWALVPHFAKAAKLPYSTNNARAEEVSNKASFREPWKRGQRR